MYHISDLKIYNRCPRLFMLREEMPKAPFFPYVRMDEEITRLAAEKLGIHEYYLGIKGDPGARALAAMKDHEWLVKARFTADGLRVKVPFLHHVKDHWDLYFLFVGLYPHADDMQFYTDTYWVLKENDVQIGNIFMIHLNADYQRNEKLDVQELFTVTRRFYNKKNHPAADIKDAIKKNSRDLKPLLERMKLSGISPLPAAVHINPCTRISRCRCYDLCFPDEKNLPDSSIQFLVGTNSRKKMEESGIKRLKDADPAMIEGTGIQYAQIKADQNGGLFVDRLALQNWLDGFSYPVIFLDFEWERFAIPPYNGMKPYDVLLFEYSIHILDGEGKLEHRSFLSVHDDRRALAESLLDSIPANGTIVAYNATGAEMIRIEELADQFPDLKDRLLDLNLRMKDMQIPFITGMVYDVRMRGSWTLKAIMAIMDDPGYENLDIRQGMDAVYQWRILDKDADLGKAEIITKELKDYCGMDTYAMVTIFHWLTEIAVLVK